ncbi:DUF202 domain-containing protein [Rhodococcus sp. WB9]|uniref:DUF202 domain-containing protein n=1 Tax=Rhodococcus sp. WB9 TaxID=2594007 RepID=UPI001186AD6C|nr:DUF202 domain-containing protein [Rhodococcus sp. WB9]QDQ94283.1 DUF202 domain-containing protein [Rhodococcus sp. WB9]
MIAMSPGQHISRDHLQNLFADGGLQPERTALAWRRTSGSFLVFALADLRLAKEMANTWLDILGGFLAVLAIAILLLTSARSLPRSDRWRGLRNGRIILVSSGTLAFLVALAALTLGTTGFVMVFSMSIRH